MLEYIFKTFLSYQKETWNSKEYRKAKLLVLFCLYSSTFSVFYILISIFIEFKAGAYSQGLTLFLFLALIASHKIKTWSNETRGTIFVLIGYQTIAILPMYSGGIENHSIILPWLAVIPVAASLFTSPKQSWIWLILCVLTIIGYTFVPAEYTPITYNREYEKIFSMIVYIGLVLILLLINLTFKRSEETALEKLDFSNKQILSSIRYAELIQKVILPKTDTKQEVFKEQFSIIKAKDVVSGDFIWVKNINSLQFWAVVDCTGHGVPGAFITFVINNLLNEITESGVQDPGKILTLLHQKVENTLNSLTSQTKEGCDIALCVYNFEESTLNFAGARRPLLKIEDGITEKYHGNKCSIGGILSEKHRDFQFKTISLALNKNCTICLYSDGITDQFHHSDAKKYGERKLISYLESIEHLSLAKQKNQLEQEIKNWKGSSTQIDDISFFAVRPKINDQLNLNLDGNSI